VLGLYGGVDQGIPVESVDRMAAACKAAGKTCEFKVYPEAPHAFNADYRPSYRADAAKDASARKPASPGWFFTRGAPSRASRPMKQRSDRLNPRAVLGPVKAWPGNAGARGKANATANLDRPGDGFSSITPR
jgi:hypothetical protein